MKNRFKQMFQPYQGEIKLSFWHLLFPILIWGIVIFVGYTVPNMLHIPESVPGSAGLETPWIRLALTLPLPLIAFYFIWKASNGIMGRHWGAFKQHLWRNLAITLLLFIGIQLIAYVIFKPLLNIVMGPASAVTLNTSTSLLLGSLIPLTAPFSEELTVHYLISEQFTDTKAKLWLGIIVSNVIFAALHVYALNFSPYMLIFYFLLGMMFHFVSLYFKNIWFNIFVHFWWNLLGALAGIISFIIILFQ